MKFDIKTPNSGFSGTRQNVSIAEGKGVAQTLRDAYILIKNWGYLCEQLTPHRIAIIDARINDGATIEELEAELNDTGEIKPVETGSLEDGGDKVTGPDKQPEKTPVANPLDTENADQENDGNDLNDSAAGDNTKPDGKGAVKKRK